MEESSNWIPYLSILIAVISAIISMTVWRTSRQTLKRQNVKNLSLEYRSSEMLFAVRRFWELYRENGDEFIQKFFEIDKMEMQKLAKIAGYNRKSYIESTINYQRRLIISFYTDLAISYQGKLLHKKDLFLNWSKADIDIIPIIIQPVEIERLRKIYGTKMPSYLNDKHPLRKLIKEISVYSGPSEPPIPI